jgi:lysophospholipase L1-like esterase
MSYQLAAMGIAPVLVAQALYVRCVTPRLPEAAGARHGVEGAGKSLRLLIVGDSAAAGVGVKSQGSALSGRLASMLAPRFHLSWRLIAKTGHKVHDVLNHIESVPQETFDVAVVSVGVNDVTHGTSLRKWRVLLSQLCERLHSRFGIQYVFLTSVPPMHEFPALPLPLRWYLGKRAASFNEAMRHLTDKSEKWDYVQPEFPLTGEFMAADGFHPGSAAYSIWAEQMAAAIRQKWQ